MLGLALSGGGFRATLFHLGSLLRLNEAGLLSVIDEFTSVSGGSIISAWLGVNWNKFNSAEQAKLINWGFALADAALRSRYDSAIAASAGLPLPDNLA